MDSLKIETIKLYCSQKILTQEAANRLAKKAMAGHMTGSIAHYNLENRECSEIECEIVRAVGDMTEHTNEKL